MALNSLLRADVPLRNCSLTRESSVERHLNSSNNKCSLVTYTTILQLSLDFVWDNTGKLVPEGTFCPLLDFLVQNEDNAGIHTNNLDGLPPHPD